MIGHYNFYDVMCFIRPSEAKQAPPNIVDRTDLLFGPTSTLQRIGDSLGEDKEAIAINYS